MRAGTPWNNLKRAWHFFVVLRRTNPCQRLIDLAAQNFQSPYDLTELPPHGAQLRDQYFWHGHFLARRVERAFIFATHI